MEHERRSLFDAAGFLALLESLQEQGPDHQARTGVLSAKIYVRDGEPWAISVWFDDDDKAMKAA